MKNKMKKLLEALKEEREILPQYSMFGNDNWEALDSQICLLKRAVKGKYIDYEKEEKDDNLYDLIQWLINDCDDMKSDIYTDYCE